MTKENELFKHIYQKHIQIQADKVSVVFSVPIGTDKETNQAEFHPDTPNLVYKQHEQNNCCFCRFVF